VPSRGILSLLRLHLAHHSYSWAEFWTASISQDCVQSLGSFLASLFMHMVYNSDSKLVLHIKLRVGQTQV
jgi:hypothetical protein